MTLEEYTCELFNCEINDLFIRTRKRNVVDARRVCMSAMRKFTNLTYQKIGEYFYKPHDIVIYHTKVFENLCATDKDFRGKANMVYSAIDEGRIDVPYGKAVKSIDRLDEEMIIYADLI